MSVVIDIQRELTRLIGVAEDAGDHASVTVLLRAKMMLVEAGKA